MEVLALSSVAFSCFIHVQPPEAVPALAFLRGGGWIWSDSLGFGLIDCLAPAFPLLFETSNFRIQKPNGWTATCRVHSRRPFRRFGPCPPPAISSRWPSFPDFLFFLPQLTATDCKRPAGPAPASVPSVPFVLAVPFTIFFRPRMARITRVHSCPESVPIRVIRG
jgi:hypothetical protein